MFGLLFAYLLGRSSGDEQARREQRPRRPYTVQDAIDERILVIGCVVILVFFVIAMLLGGDWS